MNEASDEMVEAAVSHLYGDWATDRMKDSMRASIRGALTAALAARPVRVRKLEWSDSGSVPDGPWSETRLRQARGHHHLGRYAGSYCVQELEPDGKWGWWNSWTSDRHPEGVEDSKELAQAAAQADYEARILAALEDGQ